MSWIKRLRQPLIAALSALLLTVGFVSSAMAFSTGTSFTVSPGARVCLAPQYATSYVNVEGHASKGARFLVLWGYSSGDVSTEIWRTPTDTITDTNASFNPYTFPGRFPGWFRACVRNVNTTPINVTLTMNGQ